MRNRDSMVPFDTVFDLLRYSLAEVESNLAKGQEHEFQPAIPTKYDAFFVMAQQLGILEGLEKLTDGRVDPAVPSTVLSVLMVCRFLHCLKTFGRTGEVLLRYHPLLERLGVNPVVLERGGYYQCKRSRIEKEEEDPPKPFDQEVFSEFLRLLKPEELNALLKLFIQALRRRHPELFRRGIFVMDSNHYRVMCTGEEYKWCALMLWTPKGMIPVWYTFSRADGEGSGETSLGKVVIKGAIETYGKGFIKMVLMDTGYLDGEDLAWMKREYGIDWMMDPKEKMTVTKWMLAEAANARKELWRRVEPPKLDKKKTEMPIRHVFWLEDLHNFYTYGERVNGCVIRDTYPKATEDAEEEVVYQCVVTSRRDWNAVQIHNIWRLRWCIENAFGAMTENWGLGQWQIRRADVYQATIQYMAMTYGLLVCFIYEEGHEPSLRKMADRFERQQGMVMLRVGRACVILTAPILKEWERKGLLRFCAP